MRKFGVYVYDAMTTNPVSCTSGLSVYDLANLMIKKGVGSVLVKRGDKITGIVTEKDILKKVVAKGKDPKKLLVRNIMTRKVITVEPEMDLALALKLMNKNKIRRLPVVKESTLVGIITLKDILKIQPELIDLITESIDVKEAERKPFSLKGKCQLCGREGVIFNVNGSLVCGACKNKMYEG